MLCVKIGQRVGVEVVSMSHVQDILPMSLNTSFKYLGCLKNANR